MINGYAVHGQSRKAMELFAQINGLVKEHGHVPQTELVLHDLDEATKEKALAVHSEKLAVSFGLISTPPGTIIKIVKNLRACSD
ncbi:hypothetical protein PR202_ga28642 [Eleusine coracana subsp. coracana]|uniref:DYW domain-containing protein n=1 Tax=Eleusine coracana subsp. coracana TaxID=191504 RepID=A0AAV5DKA3_ELECO|nr:hypothetical protein PR202_ga28642 [Eleusine coracana subsp. coracana]